MARSTHRTLDDELLFLACILHDLGLTERHMGDGPFQINSADAASALMQRHAVPKDRIDVVWDGIALHPYGEIASRKQPEIAMVSSGAGTDVVGYALECFSREDVNAILAAFPRRHFKSAFVRTCAEVVRRHPDGARHSFMQDIGERCVAGFHPPNICDAIAAAPFRE